MAKIYEAAPVTVATTLDTLAHDITQWAFDKGFWSVPQDVMAADLSEDSIRWVTRLVKAQKLALIVTETAEAVEALRKTTDSGLPGYTNEEEEMADQLIRILDYCGKYKLRIGAATVAKMLKNEGRPHKHGKNF